MVRALVVALVAAGFGCEGPVGASRASIIDGEPAPDAEAVVAIVERSASCAPEPRQLRCTGSLVGPRAVLTAAHCLGDGAASDLAVLFDASLDGAGALVGVARGEAHPSFDPETRAFDLAVLVLAEDAPVEPLPFGAAPAAGSAVTMLGYGGVRADDPVGGERRRGAGQVEVADPTELRIVPDPAMSCRGDSGGPVLDSSGALVAVTSRGDPACAEHAMAARVDAATDFLEAALADSVASPPAQRPFDPAEHFCEATCATDADCPTGTHCFGAEGAPRRCLLPGLSSGELLGACADPRACGEGPCVATPAGCQCFQPCGFHSHADMGTDDGGGSGGCGVAGRPGAWAAWWLLLALCPSRRRLSKG